MPTVEPTFAPTVTPGGVPPLASPAALPLAPEVPVDGVVVVTRERCHLCDVAVQVVEAECELAERPVPWCTVDLDRIASARPELFARWTDLVPVVLVDGVELSHWRVDAAVLRSALFRRARR